MLPVRGAAGSKAAKRKTAEGKWRSGGQAGQSPSDQSCSGAYGSIVCTSNWVSSGVSSIML